MATLDAKKYKVFEDIKHTTDNGIEFWNARELSFVLEYTECRDFSKVIDKAMLACQNSGFECADHFVEVNKTIAMPEGASKKVKDYELSRYACYLIVQNGDPRKEPIALVKHILLFKQEDKKLWIPLISLMKTTSVLLFVGEVTTWNMQGSKMLVT